VAIPVGQQKNFLQYVSYHRIRPEPGGTLVSYTCGAMATSTAGHGGGRTWSTAAFSLRHTLKMMLHMSDIVFQHKPQCDAVFSKEPDAGKVRLVKALDGLREMKIKHLPK
jgi:hypothetical protein